MRKLFTFARFMLGDQLVVSWRVGRKDFDGAIRVLEKSLLRFSDSGAAADAVKSGIFAMIAMCHEGAQRDDDAIAAAKRAHALDPRAFELNRMLTEFHVKRGEHDMAVGYVRLSLVHSPSAFRVPRFWVHLWDCVLYVHPRLRGLATRMEHDLEASNRENVQWRGWAKRYLAWYDAEHGTKEAPTIH